MFKKAGIIVGVLIIILALVLNWMFNGEDKKEINPNKATTEISNAPAPQPTATVPNNTQQQVVTTQPVVNQPVQQVGTGQPVQQITTTTTTISEVDITQLGESTNEETEVVLISKKAVILLDANPNSNDGKQLAYSLELITGSNAKLQHYVSATVYEAFAVGDKLKLTYNVYKNTNGVVFNTIKSVESVK